MVAVAVIAVALTLFAPKDIFSRVLFSWVALGAAIGPAVLTRCLGWRVKGGAVFAAILVGFGVAVAAYNGEMILLWLVLGGEGDVMAYSGSLSITPVFDMIEKWGSWVLGLSILALGRARDDVSTTDAQTDNNQTSAAGLS